MSRADAWKAMAAPLPAGAIDRLQDRATLRLIRLRALRHYRQAAREACQLAPSYAEYNAAQVRP